MKEEGEVQEKRQIGGVKKGQSESRKKFAADMGVDYCLEARLQLLRLPVQQNTLFT